MKRRGFFSRVVGAASVLLGVEVIEPARWVVNRWTSDREFHGFYECLGVEVMRGAEKRWHGVAWRRLNGERIEDMRSVLLEWVDELNAGRIA
jgi:hypothetical protein